MSEQLSVMVPDWLASESAIRDVARKAGGRVLRAAGTACYPVEGWDVVFEYPTEAMQRVALKTFYEEAAKDGWKRNPND